MDLQAYFAQMAAYLTSGVGNFLIIDLIAATTNALNGALLAQRPDYYRGRQWTLVGITILAIFGGIGGGSARHHCRKAAAFLVDEPLVPDFVRAGGDHRHGHRLR